jgi:hypothetical protein
MSSILSNNITIPRIVLLVGKKGAGKDTVANHLKSQGWVQFAFADTIKESLCVLMGWDMTVFEHPIKEAIDLEWNTSPRQMCQLIGTEFLRQQCSFLKTDVRHPNDEQRRFNATFHIKRLHMKLCQYLKDHPSVPGIVITDGRFPDELQYVRELMGGILWKIERTSANHCDTHASEAYIDEFPREWFHRTIYNDGTIEELYRSLSCSLL